METLEGSNIEPLLTTAAAFPSLPLSMVCIECNSVVAWLGMMERGAGWVYA